MKLNVLICPLDWGLGHASRDIPIIYEFIERGHKVTIAAGEKIILFLQKEFPSLEYILFENFKITYPQKGSFFFHFLLRFPKMLKSVYREHYKLNEIIKHNAFDVIISDNRYGLWNRKLYTLFITHQLAIKIPNNNKLASYLVRKINYQFINKFTCCWVPDHIDNPYLAGELSHPKILPKNISYIGILSRFSCIYQKQTNNFNESYDIIAIISGPEPQRTIFEELLISQMHEYKGKCMIVRGLPEYNTQREENGNVVLYSHLESSELQSAIKNASYIISRSGYSTIMDFITLKRTACLVPTPGQTEQEHLAEYYAFRKIFVTQKQHSFNLRTAISQLSVYNNFYLNINRNLLKSEIIRLESHFEK
jgi:uncharacterized protein (TIGR00661 family)